MHPLFGERNKPRQYDTRNAPAEVMLFNPTPFTINCRAHGCDITLPPNTMTGFCDRGYLDDAGHETDRKMPITNVMIEVITSERRSGKYGVIPFRNGDNLADKAREGLERSAYHWDRQEQVLIKKVDDARAAGNQSIQIDNFRFVGPGSPWFRKPEIEMVKFHQDALKKALADVDKWVKQTTIIQSLTTDSQIAGYQKQLTKLQSDTKKKDDEIAELRRLLEEATAPAVA